MPKSKSRAHHKKLEMEEEVPSGTASNVIPQDDDACWKRFPFHMAVWNNDVALLRKQLVALHERNFAISPRIPSTYTSKTTKSKVNIFVHLYKVRKTAPRYNYVVISVFLWYCVVFVVDK